MLLLPRRPPPLRLCYSAPIFLWPTSPARRGITAIFPEEHHGTHAVDTVDTEALAQQPCCRTETATNGSHGSPRPR